MIRLWRMLFICVLFCRGCLWRRVIARRLRLGLLLFVLLRCGTLYLWRFWAPTRGCQSFIICVGGFYCLRITMLCILCLTRLFLRLLRGLFLGTLYIGCPPPLLRSLCKLPGWRIGVDLLRLRIFLLVRVCSVLPAVLTL